MTSRLCIKNIPKHATEESVRAHFSTLGGTVTDVRVLKTPRGVPRRMAFVGFRTSADAEKAQKYFDKTFLDTSKLQVEFAAPLGDPSLEQKKQRLHKQPLAKPAAAQPEGKKPASEKHREFMQLMQPKKQALQAEEFWANGGSGEEEDGAEEEQPPQPPQPEGRAPSSNRLFVRNLSYSCTKEDLEQLFGAHASGPAVATLPLDEAQRPKGFAIIALPTVQAAVRAQQALNNHAFQGRLLHVLPAHPDPRAAERAGEGDAGQQQRKRASYKTDMEDARRKRLDTGQDESSWAALFVRADAAAGAVASALGLTKAQVILGDNDDEDNAAVRVAMSEARVVAQGKEFLRSEGVDMAALDAALRGGKTAKSENVLLVKNLPENTNEADLRSLFTKHGVLDRFVLPPSRTMALVSFSDAQAAKRALRDLAYTRYKSVPLYLQWAPDRVLAQQSVAGAAGAALLSPGQEHAQQEEEGDLKVAATAGRAVFIKNLEFSVTDKLLERHLLAVGKVRPESVTIPQKRGKSGEDLSAGFGFAQYESEAVARRVLKLVNGSTLQGHVLDAKMSERPATAVPKAVAGAANTKLVVRNLAFETTKKEIKQLFSAFGNVKSVRLPKKFDGSLRGFAFVDFVSNAEARAAFAGLASTHLYGRHLVIEWASAGDELGAAAGAEE